MNILDLFRRGSRPNVLLIITDQQRAVQHFSADFESKKLLSLTHLKASGLSFERAFTAAAACAPGRASLMTSQYPAKHGTKVTFPKDPSYPLNHELVNLANVMEWGGYATRAWFGKWHLGERGPDQHGFTEWGGPDAGTTISNYKDLGGGTPNYDEIYLEQMKEFLNKRTSAEPFFMVASFVNPHDGFVAFHGLEWVHIATDKTATVESSGYSTADLVGPETLPPNEASGVNTPRAHKGMTWTDGMITRHTKADYINFYANLQVKVDVQISALLDAMGSRLEDTLVIRCADHGEMALAHSLIEKFYNAYEESIRIPLVFSHPGVWPQGATTNAFASLVDLAPTMASLLGVSRFCPGFDGQDLTQTLVDPSVAVQDHVHFTYDDSGPATAIVGPAPVPALVRTIRTERWKYSVYFTVNGLDGDWELYDLKHDDLEQNNLAGNPGYAHQQLLLDLKLQATMRRLGTMPLFTWPPRATANSRGVLARTPAV